MSQSIDASNATAKELSYATRKISGEDGVLREASRFTSDTLGYGAIVEGREGAYIIVNVLASPSALQETSSSTICLTAACSPLRDPAGNHDGPQFSWRCKPAKLRTDVGLKCNNISGCG